MENCIKVMRKQLKMTQANLAERCGVVRQTINCIENDKYDPTLELAFKISRTLGKTMEEVFNYD